ncbi:MAG TPA: efflux RND transporter permease subunit [Polyangia bacterium]|jgi:hydrophobe/amphiphile efflux-1 (HAE1) family protein|nr:efflux RND transporter permease subunit [Polyangia bacterium]
MQWLASISVRRPVFATVMILTIAVVGILGYSKLNVDRFPNVDFPIISIVTTLPGAAPEEVETELTDKIEEAVNTLGGIDELRSVSTEGVSQVFVTFTLDHDVNVAAQDVRDHVNLVLNDLPEGTKPPVIGKLDPDAAPVLLVAMDGKLPVRELTEIADHEVRQALESIEGVGQVSIVGGRKRQVQVFVDPQKMRSAGISATEIQRAIISQNVTTPGGAIETGPQRLTFRVRGRITSVDGVGDIIIRNVDNHPILVRDVATVVDGQEEAETSALVNGKASVVLSIRKQSGENSVAVVDALRVRMKELEPALPGSIKLTVIRDNTESTRTSVDAVREHLILGAFLASLVVLVFLGNFRSTIIAALAIPTSIVGTFMLMSLMGFTLNVITLLALALAVGIVIDDAIVVLENIVRFVEEKRVRPMPAAIYATKEIGLAVLATTLSLLAVFLPVAFMNSIPGRFLRSFGLTMGAAIAISLFVSFTLTPMLASRWLRLRPEGEHKKGALERLVDLFYRPIERLYMKVLGYVIDRRWIVVVASFATLGSCVPLVKAVPKGFLPKNDEAQFEFSIRTPEGTSLAATELAAERVAREVREWPEVSQTNVTIGDNATKTANLASIFVRLVPPDHRKLTQDQLEQRARKEIVTKLPKSYRVSVLDVAAFGGGAFSTATVQYTLTGPDLAKLGEYAETISNKLRQVPGAVDIDTSMITGNPEVVAVVNRRKAADLGVNVADVAAAAQILIGGLKVSRYEESGREYDILVRAEEQFRSSQQALALLTVPSSKLGAVPLLDVVELKPDASPSKIDRLSRQRQVTFLANTAPGVGASEIGTALEKIVANEHLPGEYRFAPFGQSKEIKRTGQNFIIAFGLAFIFMYLILAAQFESWLHPVTILLALPLTVPFALISLLIFKQSLDIFTMLGILVLFGVVKKNSILQIDHINHLRREGYSRRDAILHGNRDRLRPILMTTLAFVAGMLPLVTSKGIGAEFNRATAGPVVGGQVLSLLLTLLATPVAYSLFDDLSVKWKKLLRIKPRPDSETGASEVMGPPSVVVPEGNGHKSGAEVQS